jgi:hypothetical protein
VNEDCNLSLSYRPGYIRTPDDTPTFALRADDTTYQFGDAVTITLTNLLPERNGTGNRHKYNIQVLTEAGWQDVRGSTNRDLFPYTDEGILHDPGEGFEWTFDLTAEGVTGGHVHEDDLEVCPDLQPGRYRFLFWEPTVAVTVDVTE